MSPLFRALKAACFVTLVATCVSCGGSSPSSPSNTTASGTTTPTYFGNIRIGDTTGTILARGASSLSSLAPRSTVLATLLSWIEVPVYADSASGLLSLSDGTVVTLAGTYSGGVFSLSGGGYTITLTTSGGSLAGSGTAPGGAAAVVAPPDPVIAPVPAPPNPSGTYTASYRIDAPSYFVNTRNSDGAVLTNCTYNTVVTGTLTLTLSQNAANNYEAFLSAAWTDTPTQSGSCSVIPSPVTTLGPEGADFAGPPSNIQTAFVGQGTPNGGILIRVGTFVGAVSGNTVVGRYARSEDYTVNLGTQIHKEGYAASAASVVLTKQ